MKQIETLLQCNFYHGAKIMEAIGYFFSRVFGGFVDRFSDQMRYKVTDIAETKIRETVEKPFNRDTTAYQKKAADGQD
jgi:hypothetical protein